uniref:Beta-hexosaminidase n=1 Tax=Romanomermis culicivorax TaxID=13658 RepID=A0A915IL08_ROMCU
MPNLEQLTFLLLLANSQQTDRPNLNHWSRTDVSSRIKAQQRAMPGDLKTTVPSEGMPWPKPQKMILNQHETLILTKSNFDFSTVYECDIVEKALIRYKELLFRGVVEQDSASNDKNQIFFARLFVHVKEPCEKYPHENMDESYKLSVFKNGTGFLEARSVWGALRGLETFSQLTFSPDSKRTMIKTVEIEDFPRFAHRGILIDTARHYVKMPILLENLDIMSQNKMNVFHWHIVDDQSFPYESKVFPLLSRRGEIFECPRNDLCLLDYYIYMLNDYPVIISAYNGPDGTFGPMDPTKNETYDFLAALIAEVSQLFPDKYIHLGGDEVPFECWASNPKIRRFMREMKFEQNFVHLEQYFVQKLMTSIRQVRGEVRHIFWQEVFDNGVGLSLDTVIHVWKGLGKPHEYENELHRVTSNKLKAILSSCWYLNYVSYGMDWPKYYSCDPHSFHGTLEQKALVLGGEACMWGEFVDSANVIQTLWPRASSVSERLWSDASVTDVDQATPRLEGHRCLLKRRGHQVGPISGPSFCSSDFVR